ncbi:ribonuclease E [Raineyella antarctica]|uniref:Ribonuclease E n=1 Tax=Raineyella antarctica TaxID=1577474 RepID=A0A1G6GEF0_9ACTN|nr:ribonuclease E [Raineyella antarctica]
MLDNEQQPTDTTVDPSLPKPPAGRRSRRRPAGPPAPVETVTLPVEAPVTPVEEAPAEVAPEPSPVEAVAPEEEPEPEQAEPEQAEPEQAEPEQAEPEQAEPEQAEPEQAEPEQPQDEEEGSLAQIDAAAEHADSAAADQPDDEAEAEHTPSDRSEQSDSPRRRRRRRGGRRRHTGGDGQSDRTDEDEGDEDEDVTESTAQVERPAARAPRPEAIGPEPAEVAEVAESAEEDEDEDDSAAADAGSSGSSRRRRRRRRRRGEDASTGAEDDPSEVVVKVREKQSSDDEIHGVEGSTRLEAKRQRRREGRAAGRRRAPIVSESEFLARRESVNRQMVLRQSDEFSQIAVLEDGILVEHYVDRESSSSLIGNIYLGRVQNVLPSMEAAFIDIGRGRNAVLYAGELDWDAYGSSHSERKIEHVLKSGQQILVQVTKDPVGAKGARLTNHVSIPGRYVVYAPGGHLSGISRKLPDVERKRLKHILADLIEEGASVIVRTAAEGASQEQLVHDVNRLKSQWDAIDKKAQQGGAPQQLYSEPDLTIRTVRDLFTEDFAELIIDGNGTDNDAYDVLAEYLEHVAPHLRERVSHWDRAAKGDVFSHYRLDEQIAKALERKVHLPSGGSLIIDRTEAMTVIDVNTGKFTGHGGNLEATVTANNLEAAEEIIRQLRLRDIGGIIVVDFIDMVLPSNRELLLRRMVECLGRDRTRHQVSEVTSLGLVQMTRKKIGTGLAEAFTEPCECCNQRGYIVHDMPVATQAPSDGGDRQGRNNRKRNRGKSTGSQPVTSQPTGSGETEGHQPAARAEAETEHLSEEARAAAQAAISAVAHAGAKPRPGADNTAMLDDLVAALQEGRPEDAARDDTSAEVTTEEAPAEPAPTRTRSRRSRSRRSTAAQEAAAPAAAAQDTAAQDAGKEAGQETAAAVDVPATVQEPAMEAEGADTQPAAEQVTAEPAETGPSAAEPASDEQSAGEQAEEEQAAEPVATKRASTRKSAARSTTKKAATKRASTAKRTTKKAAAAPAPEPGAAQPEAAQPVEDAQPVDPDQVPLEAVTPVTEASVEEAVTPDAGAAQEETPGDAEQRPLDQEPIDLDPEDMDSAEIAPLERIEAPEGTDEQ